MFINKKDAIMSLLKNIPVIFPGQFPDGYKNNVKYWGNISREDLHSTLPDGTAKLITLDIDIGDACSLRCPACFRRDDRFDIVNKENKLSIGKHLKLRVFGVRTRWDKLHH